MLYFESENVLKFYNLEARFGSLIPARPHTKDTFLEIDLEMFSTAIPLPYADSFKKGCCHVQGKVCARSIGYKGKYVHEGLVNHVNHLFKLARGKKGV